MVGLSVELDVRIANTAKRAVAIVRKDRVDGNRLPVVWPTVEGISNFYRHRNLNKLGRTDLGDDRRVEAYSDHTDALERSRRVGVETQRVGRPVVVWCRAVVDCRQLVRPVITDDVVCKRGGCVFDDVCVGGVGATNRDRLTAGPGRKRHGRVVPRIAERKALDWPRNAAVVATPEPEVRPLAWLNGCVTL